MYGGTPNVLLAVLDSGLSGLLVDTPVHWPSSRMSPVQYLLEYEGDAGSPLAPALAKLRMLDAKRYSDDDDDMSPIVHSKRRRGDGDADRLLRLADRLDDCWDCFFDHVQVNFFGLQTSVVGYMILLGGPAVLPWADKLIDAGFKLQPDVQLACPLVATVVDHFYRRCWVESQLLLPDTMTMDSLRQVLLWLSEKTNDQLQINWELP
jgi:hypothetical protein